MDDMFKPIAQQTSIERSAQHRVRPYNVIRPGEPINFVEPSDGRHALDLGRSKLYVKLKCTKGNGTDMGNNDRTGLINYPLGTLWDRAVGYLNNTKISFDNHYGLKAYIEVLLATGRGPKEEQLQGAGFFKDDCLEFDSTTLVAPRNDGFYPRHVLIDESRECELVGPLHLGMFHMGQLIPPGVSLRVELWPAENSVVLMANAGNPKITILDAAIFLHKVQLSDEYELRMMKGLTTQNAIYRLPNAEVRTYPIAHAATTFSADNCIVTERLPNTLVIGFTRTAAFQGDYKKNLLYFKQNGLNNLEVEVNGETLRGGGGDNIDLMDYLSLFDGRLEDEGVGFEFDDHPLGFYLVRFQIAPFGNEYVSKVKSGKVSIRGAFKPALTEAMTMFVYMQYQSEMQIDKKKQIHLL